MALTFSGHAEVNMSEIDFSEGLDFGGEPEPAGDPCTSLKCPHRLTCDRFDSQADPTPISNKYLASSSQECPFFEPITNRYPPALRHAMFTWSDHEESLQSAALGWFLLWRKTNPFLLNEDDGFFTRPIEDTHLWNAMKPRILDWAWAEKGGLNLEDMHSILRQRGYIRLKQTPTPFNPPPAASVADTKRKQK